MSKIAFLGAFMCFAAALAHATIFGGVHLLVHDPEHRAITGAKITLHDSSSGVELSGVSDRQGVAVFRNVPLGQYVVEIHAQGFSETEVDVSVVADRVQVVHVPMKIASVSESVNVVESDAAIYGTEASPSTLISRENITAAPGADRANSLRFITDFVPGAYVVHDQLHVRGGHQVTWAVDGVPIPNTNIASNVGPQFDPKDVQYVEAQRGSYMADYGDRTYGVFNVVPRSGFERNRIAELELSYGNFHQTDNHLSFADHSDHFAYYVSANGNRSDFGLEPPTYANLHNQASGGGLFSSLTYNAKNGDQLRFVGSARADYYQVPNTPDMQDSGIRDREREQDALSSLTYLHPIGSNTVLNVTPFFHFNRAAYEGSAAETPAATDNRASTYFGGQASLSYSNNRHNARVGFYGFGQHDNHFFQVVANDGSGNQFSQHQPASGNIIAGFVEDQYRPWAWLSLMGGVRLTRFSGELEETAASPRLGAAVTIPKVHVVLRAAYSRFYQAPPLSTVSGPLLEFALEQGVGFLPLRGERDEQHDFGITIPVRGWSFEVDNFRTAARNFFDHDALGNSNIFLPLTIDRVRIKGTEVALRSPRLFGKVNLHLAYSHQTIQGMGAVSGGLTDFAPPEEGSFYLDHDQRNTLSAGMLANLPWRTWTSLDVSYGSGFLNGDGPDHLPTYGTLDVAVGKSFGERWSAKVTALNISNERHYIDYSNTFGGSHVNEPRSLALQVRYQFHY